MLESHVTSEVTSKKDGKAPKQRKILDDVWAVVGGDEYLTEKEI